MPSAYPADPPPPSSRIADKPTSTDRPHRLWHPNSRPAVYSRAFVPQRVCNIATAVRRRPCRRFPLSPAAGRFAAAGGGRYCRWTRGHRDRSVLRPILVAGGAGGCAPLFQFICPRSCTVITVGGQVSFGIGRQFFIGRHGIGSRWRICLYSGLLIGHGGIFPAGGNE